MKLNHLEDFKSKIAAGKICQGLVVQLADPVVGELAGEAGFDFTWIDAEHCPHTLQTIQNLVLAQRGTGCAPFVRAAWKSSAFSAASPARMNASAVSEASPLSKLAV